MHYPQLRLRRRRSTPAIRELLQETRIHIEDLIYPLFVCAGTNKREPVEARLQQLWRLT
jgi:porphobilinogen synthase